MFQIVAKGEGIMEFLDFTFGTAVIWIVLAVVLAIVEAMTVGLFTIWFAAGALVASLLSYYGAPFWAQVLVFLLISLLLLYFTKPLALKKLKIGTQKTNTDAILGQVAMVTEEIPPFGTGQVKLSGLIWTAVTMAGSDQLPVPTGTRVKVKRIEGVKLVVEPVDQASIN